MPIIYRAQYDSRGQEIVKLETNNTILTEDQKELSRKLSETKYMLQSRSDECKSIQLKYIRSTTFVHLDSTISISSTALLFVRVDSLEIQKTQLQKELATLRKVLLEVEEQKKKIEARSRYIALQWSYTTLCSSIFSYFNVLDIQLSGCL